METLKGVIFPLLMALLTFIPYGMRHYGPLGTYLAPLKPFVFGTSEPSATGSGRSALMKGAVRDPLALARETYRGSLLVTVLPLSLYSLEQSAMVLASLLGSEVKTHYKMACALKDGTPAYEAELKRMEDGREVTTMMVAAMKGGMLVMAALSQTSGPSEEEMKSILYSLKTT